MIEIETKTVKLSEIHLNPDNPRTITKQAMERLVKSLQDFPDMMKLREIVVDESMMVLGGNMRLLALQKIGEKDCPAKIVTGLSPEQKREFVIKDNAAFGAWDMDALANSWSDLPLTEWGVDLPAFSGNGILDLTDGNGENRQTTYDKLADKKGGVLFNFGDIQQSIPFDVYEVFFGKINMSSVKESLIEALSK